MVEFARIIQAFAMKAVKVDKSKTTSTWISQLNHITTFSNHSESFQKLLETPSTHCLNPEKFGNILSDLKKIKSDSLIRVQNPNSAYYSSPRILKAFNQAILMLVDVIEITRNEIRSIEAKIAQAISSKRVENPWLTNMRFTKWEKNYNITHVDLKEIENELNSSTHEDYVDTLHVPFDEDVKVATNMRAECIGLIEKMAQIISEHKKKPKSIREEDLLNNIEVLFGYVIKLFMRQNELLMSLNRVHLRIKNHQQYRLIWVEKLIGLYFKKLLKLKPKKKKSNEK